MAKERWVFVLRSQYDNTYVWRLDTPYPAHQKRWWVVPVNEFWARRP
jgi:hypothetical protein